MQPNTSSNSKTVQMLHQDICKPASFQGWTYEAVFCAVWPRSRCTLPTRDGPFSGLCTCGWIMHRRLVQSNSLGNTNNICCWAGSRLLICTQSQTKPGKLLRTSNHGNGYRWTLSTATFKIEHQILILDFNVYFSNWILTLIVLILHWQSNKAQSFRTREAPS